MLVSRRTLLVSLAASAGALAIPASAGPLVSEAPPLTTPWPEIDALTGGFRPGELVVVGGRPGMGKTSILLNLARHWAVEQRIPSSFLSLEISEHQMAMRLACHVSRTPCEAARIAGIEPDSRLREARLWIDAPDKRDVRSDDVRAFVEESVGRHAARVVFVDVAQLVRAPKGRTLAGHLKLLASRHEVTIIVASLAKHEVESRRDHRPEPSDLRYHRFTGIADTFLMLTRQGYYAADAAPEVRKRLEVAVYRRCTEKGGLSETCAGAAVLRLEGNTSRVESL